MKPPTTARRRKVASIGRRVVVVGSIAVVLAACGSTMTATPAPRSTVEPQSAASPAAVSPAGGANAPASVLGSQPVPGLATPNPDAPPSGLVLRLDAMNVRWHPAELHAPVDKRFQLELRNDDAAEQHNFLVANGQKPTVTGRLFVSGPAFGGPATRTYDVPGLPAGRYVFWCAVHPELMVGTLVVE